MGNDRKQQEELQQANAQTSVTVEEVTKHKRKRKKLNLWKAGRFLLFSWKRSSILLLLLAILLVITLPFAAFQIMKLGSTFTEQKGAFVEKIQELKELTTANSYTKVLIEREDNELFGQSIGVNFPGTKRKLLVVIPGSIRAGIDLSRISEKDIALDDDAKKVKLTVPAAEFLGGAELYFDQVEIYSYEGLFRGKADIEEAYELAAEAKQLIITEATEQGVLEAAERNAERTLREMFSFAGYELEIEFKE